MIARIWLGVVAVLAAAVAARGQEADVADVPSVRVELGEKRAYFLVGAGRDQAAADAAAAPARPLLIVLPGGDGGEGFNPFVRRMWKNALPGEFVVAQLVAVSSADARQVVWPTAKLRHAKQAFTTEAFVADVVADVGRRVKIDPKRVYALGWSSSGPALYAAAATEGTPVAGYFVAMSVFKAEQLPKPAAVKGKRFYLLHSPDDRVCPIRMAREAKERLAGLGADVTLAEYAGGHGWKGDVSGNVRAGVEWLGRNE